jgi:hypothetical protein
MNIKEFIESEIRELASIFSYVEIYYEYKEVTNSHFIKVIPQSVFNSIEFVKIKSNISRDFLKNNYSGLLCFVSEDSRVKLSGASKIYSSFENIEQNRHSWNRNLSENNIFCLNTISVQTTISNSLAA